MHRNQAVRAAVLAFVLIAAMILPGSAASTTKALSTNFTLINLEDVANASGTVDYFKGDGTAWKTSDSFNNVPPGGQVIYRQYLDGALSAGQGSVVINSGQNLGAVVQILARPPQVATSGAYVGFSAGSQKAYVPLVMRRLSGASGVANSQVVVQNAGGSATDVTITFIGLGASSPATLQKSMAALAVGAAWNFDLEGENGLNPGWYGSAVVEATTAGGQVVAVSNLFTGPHGMQTFNAFTTPGSVWLAPLFTSRLPNGLSTPITVQNLSGGEIPANDITVTCTKNPASAGQATITIKNSAAVPNNASFGVNPVTDLSLPDNWYGSCRIARTAGGIVAFVQMRIVGTDRAAAYEALSGTSTEKQVLVPLAAKRLANQFATVLNIQNVNASAPATVDFTYIPSAEYVANGGSATPIAVNGVTIPAGASIQHNLRLEGTLPQMPNGWYGTAKIVSRDQPINGIVELTFLTGDGDTYQAHTVFTKP